MKISKLHIDQFRHLENLEFDFTYQSGERKGQPLDKICFIGQSASGKTSLLELIKEQFSFINNLFIDGEFYSDAIGTKSINGLIKFDLVNYFIELNNKNLNIDGIIYTNKEPIIGELTVKGELFKNPDEKKRIFYFKANIISEQNINFFSTNPIELIEKYHNQIEDTARYFKFEHNGEFIFNDQINTSILLQLLNDNLIYRKKFTQKMSELIHQGLIADPKKLGLEFDKWQKDNPKVLELFAKEFNTMLEKLNLEVDLINTEYSIPLKNKRTEKIIPFQSTSTGTKQLLFTSLPLYSLETTDSIILIDEPERSLYPDMQMDLMDHYQRLAPEAQFIVATHSPFITASFEADERFVLYFDEEGKVAVRRGSSPIGDDPNDMLKNDFGVNYYNKYGVEAYQKYLKLKEDLAKEKDSTKKKELLLETVKLGDTYNF